MQGYFGTTGRCITGGLAQDGNRGLIAVVGTICGGGTVLPPLIIYKGGKAVYGLVSEAANYLFAISPKG